MGGNVDGWGPRDGELNPLEVSALVSGDRTGRFVYIRHAFKRSSKLFAPYTYKLVSHRDVNQCYMTVSASGVTLHIPGEMTFTPLSMWNREYKKYLILVELKLFRVYRTWKAFYVWRRTIITARITRAMKFIQDNLFLCEEGLRTALMRALDLQWILAESNFIKLSRSKEETVFHFVEIQFTKIEDMKEKLKVLRGSAVDTLIDACVNSLAGDGYLNISGGVGARKEEDSSMSFIQEARRRNKIDRLSRFIGLADYISIFLLMKLLENTYFEFLNVITSCTKLLPDEERLKSDEKLDGADGDDQVFDSDVRSYIEIDIILLNDTGDVAIDPALKIFHLIISKIQNHWEKCLREILESHPSSVRFDNSLGSVIPCGYSKSRVGDAERLSNIIKNSLPIQNYKEELTKELNLNTNAVDLFCKRFGVIETFYKSMRACTEEIIRGNESIEVFRNWCTEYREKEEEIEEIVDTQVLGIFMVHLDGLKTQALSLLFYNRGIIADVIPKIGKSKVDILLSKILDDTTYLDTDPTTADCFANYVEFINDAQRRIDSMEIDGDYVKDLYDITEEFAIPVDPEDFANYLMINVALTSLKIAVADRLKKRDDLIAKFNEQISNDVRKLTDDVSVINELISESWLLDPASEPAICLKTLKDLDSNLQECIKIVDKYQDYQKSFDLETIRLDILDLVRREIHLRILLWECILLWEESSRRWYEGDFRDLNPEEMTQTTDQLKDNVGELETGLGRRPIVLNLKENVGQVRDKLPTISCLRNKHLRRRHWLEVEAILNYKFKPDVRITLTLIEGLGAFAYSQELMNISGRATSEANQEAILNRIDDA